ncbi:glycosyltransferase [Heliobacterium undosum]|uniref:Glycosyltransferase n=1 Tax=Heliomicrobium undosum TaxID=121734 RepID=A0A845KZ89_9FIRM|nr:glycosyltransferase [Heliomicrobium undosum]MZP29023.1 glycosyltransferase [Heliomicrobium undosum]
MSLGTPVVNEGRNSLLNYAQLLDQAVATLNDDTIGLEQKIIRCNDKYKKLHDILISLDTATMSEIAEITEDALTTSDPLLWLFNQSFLLDATKDKSYLDRMYLVAESLDVPFHLRHFLYWQIARKQFIHPYLCGVDEDYRFRRLHSSILEHLEKMIPDTFDWIPAEKRNKDIVVLITNQLLGPGHGPTQTVLDRISVLQKKLNKKVFLINSAEMPTKMLMPVYNPLIASYIDKHKGASEFHHEDIAFPCYQCDSTMPNVAEIIRILEFVADNRPSFVFSIGGNNFTADICRKIVPVATQACVNSIPVTEGQLLVLWRSLHESDQTILEKCQIHRDRIIESCFTYSIPSQKTGLSRRDLGLPEGDYVLAVVGVRLGEEMTPEFTGQLSAFLDANPHVFVAFAGRFEGYEQFRLAHDSLQRQTAFVGFQKDILAFYSLCDGFLNPIRTGGGASAVEALHQGLPVFTFPIGDVAQNAGTRYHIRDFAQIEEFIKRWTHDPEFRKEEGRIARERAAFLTDTSSALSDMIRCVESSPHYL